MSSSPSQQQQQQQQPAETLTEGVYRVLQDYTFDMLDVIESHLAAERIGQTERGKMTSKQQEEFDKIRRCMDKLASSLQNGFEENFRELEAQITQTFTGIEGSLLLLLQPPNSQQPGPNGGKSMRDLLGAIQEQKRLFALLSEQIYNALAERKATLARIAEKQARLKTAKEINESVARIKKISPVQQGQQQQQQQFIRGGYLETLDEMEVEANEIVNNVKDVYANLD